MNRTAWFVLRDGRFEVPGTSAQPALAAQSGAVAFAMLVLLVESSKMWSTLALLLFATSVLIGIRGSAQFAMALSPYGIEVPAPFGNRLVPWDQLASIQPKQFQTIGMNQAAVYQVIAHYVAHPESRPWIGTGLEFDRLPLYAAPAPAAFLPTPAPGHESLPPELRRPARPA